MTRLLIFCGNRTALEKYDMVHYGRTLVTGLAEQNIQWFHDTPGAVLVTLPYFAAGWRAPADTLVLFDASWPYAMHDAKTVQALMRVPGNAPTASPDLADAVSYGTTTGRWSGRSLPEMQRLRRKSMLDYSTLFAPYSRRRYMIAADIVPDDHPHADKWRALGAFMERDFYAEFAKSLEPRWPWPGEVFPVAVPVVMGLDLARQDREDDDFVSGDKWPEPKPTIYDPKTGKTKRRSGPACLCSDYDRGEGPFGGHFAACPLYEGIERYQKD